MKLNKDNTGFKVLPKGEYEVYPIELDKTTAKTSGNPMVVVNYIVRDDVDQEGKGQKINFDNFVEVENALWRVNQASEAAGLDMDAEYDSIYEWAEDFRNKAVRVVVGHRETDDGKVFPEVNSFKPSQVGGVYKGAKPKNDQPNVAPAGEQKKDAEPIEIDDDDLPF